MYCRGHNVLKIGVKEFIIINLVHVLKSYLVLQSDHVNISFAVAIGPLMTLKGSLLQYFSA